MRESDFLHGNRAGKESTARLSKWLRKCNCLVDMGGPLPSRLVDVNEVLKDGLQGVRLIETTDDQRGIYTCLSHCWGTTKIQCCTTKKSIQTAKDFLPFNSLPKNFQDAINITRKIRIPFIWIDSICIIQDDLRDWEIQSKGMADIYRWGYLTIAATSSADSMGGCYSVTQADLCLSIIDYQGRNHLVGARMADTSGIITDAVLVKKRTPLLDVLGFIKSGCCLSVSSIAITESLNGSAKRQVGVNAITRRSLRTFRATKNL
jgi:heterokaryon incompatibility protein (HET)